MVNQRYFGDLGINAGASKPPTQESTPSVVRGAPPMFTRDGRRLGPRGARRRFEMGAPTNAPSTRSVDRDNPRAKPIVTSPGNDTTTRPTNNGRPRNNRR